MDKKQLKDIMESYFNGQILQMVDQIQEYNDMYNVFDDIDLYLSIECLLTEKDKHKIFTNIVNAYHRITFQ